jgi:hypothetical protein
MDALKGLSHPAEPNEATVQLRALLWRNPRIRMRKKFSKAFGEIWWNDHADSNMFSFQVNVLFGHSVEPDNVLTTGIAKIANGSLDTCVFASHGQDEKINGEFSSIPIVSMKHGVLVRGIFKKTD